MTATIGSLCSGYGGLELGLLKAVGGTVAWHAEVEAAPSAVLASHWPAVPNIGDITTADWSLVEPVDWLCAGYPCQPFSQAGKRKGSADERHLWPYVAGAVRALRPRRILLENVAGHLTLGMDAVLGDLASLGYDATWGVVRASDAGAPHRRERLFIGAADTRGHGRGERPRFGRVVDGASGSAASEGDQRQRDRHTAGHRGAAATDTHSVGSAHTSDSQTVSGARAGEIAPAVGAGELARNPDGMARETASTLGRQRGSVAQPSEVERAVGSDRAPVPNATSDGRDEGRSESARLIGGSDVAERGHDAASDTDDAEPKISEGADAAALVDAWSRADAGDHAGRDAEGTDWAAYGPAVARWERILGRSAPAPTEPGRAGQRLSPRFVEWLMGLPDGWVCDIPGLSPSAQLKALGNGVVPQQAALAVRTLLNVEAAA